MTVPQPGVVAGVRRGSLAAEAGVRPGDAVVTIAGQTPRDVVDYRFLQADSEVEVRFRTPEGVEDLVIFEKEPDEDLGIEFERATWDDVLLCNNNCFFCFLKGLPKGMRKTLYLKDDDYRLSFLHGNFVTLTNLTEDDWARIAEQRLSPLNVSVHATDLDLRRRLLGNLTAPDICAQLRRLGDIGLQAHTQIVVTPGVNDGEALRRSLSDLTALYPTVQTVSVVPVGASPRLEEWSAKRDGIALERPTPAQSREILDLVAPFQRACRSDFRATVVQVSDEYYVTGEAPIPPRAHYDGFVQYENGIGMVRTMLDDWERTKRRLAAGKFAGTPFRRVAIGAGTLAAPGLQRVAVEVASLTGVEVQVVPVVNRVFGERVNVSGLVTGKDFVAALEGVPADLLVLPRSSLDYFGTQFLDSLKVDEAEAALGRPLAFASLWSDVVRILERGAKRPSRTRASNGAFWSEHHAVARGGGWVDPETGAAG
ncbi:MAG: DUF512 domain-containing protein [Dehalococcoidia bacterium]